MNGSLGYSEDQNRMGQAMNFALPSPTCRQCSAVMPADVTQYGLNPKYNGLWQFATNSNPHVFGTPVLSLQPRLGFAYRLTNSSAIRVGYARFGSTLLAVIGPNWNIPSYGYSIGTAVLPYLQGVPQATLSNPFPASSNPLLLPKGNTLGGYTNIGNSASWFNQSVKTPINDRLNFSYQSMLPGQFRMDTTYFVNFGHNIQPPSNGGGGFEQRNLNMVNPQLYYTYKGALDDSVANPFYQYGTPQNFPGALRNQQNVSVGSLLEPYPQYGSLTEKFNSGFSEHYQSIQIKAERAYSKGFTLTVGYNFNREASDIFFNDPDTYADHMTMYPVSSPRHRLNSAFAYSPPIGRGQKYLPNLNPVLNGVLGGWTTSHILMWHSGDFLTFGQMVANGNPRIPQPTRQEWFNTGDFQVPQPYTPRTNPMLYPGVTGPRYWELDSTLSKSFKLTERFRLEFRFEAYNFFNNFIPSDPDTSVYSSTFGMSTNQANTGRECQYSLRLHY